MILEIEQKIIAKLQSAGLHIKDIEQSKNIAKLRYPAVFVSVEAGKYTPISNNTRKCEVSIILSIILKDVRSEEQRRNSLYPLVEGITALFFLENLTLDISPIVPLAFRNVTQEALAEQGYIIYEIELKTAYNLTKLTESEADELLKVGLSYYINEQKKAEDIITLTS